MSGNLRHINAVRDLWFASCEELIESQRPEGCTFPLDRMSLVAFFLDGVTVDTAAYLVVTAMREMKEARS